VAALGLLVFLPVCIVVAAAIKLDSPGGVLYRCRRVGYRGRPLEMLKFRKMSDGATGAPLTAAEDPRFTRVGRVLAKTKLDELPQLWNVIKGEMSLVGPRPESPEFVELHSAAYADILSVRPGITGLSQLAFARETEILDDGDRIGDYLGRILPQKMSLDRLYAQRRSLGMDLSIIGWTLLAVATRAEVAVDRSSGALNLRRRPQAEALAVERTAYEG
jgi:lipopolysaccharide/colanic/teichoic acid biosynthesis glycosyltransferase